MTRSYQYRPNSPAIKRSTLCDLQSPKRSQLEYEITIPSSVASVSCLNNLLTDLCVARPLMKRNLGRFPHVSSKSRRCAHLASLIEQCSSSATSTPLSSSTPPPTKILDHAQERKTLSSLDNNREVFMCSRSTSTTSCDTSSSSESVVPPLSFPFNTRPLAVQASTSSAWGHFVEAEEDYHHPSE